MRAAGAAEGGFTLVEVLVALMMLAVLSVALLDAEGLAVTGAARSAARARALADAASLLAEREAGARGDGAGKLADGSTYRIVSRRRPDLVRPGAAIQPVEYRIEIAPRRAPAVRLASLGWMQTTAP